MKLQSHIVAGMFMAVGMTFTACGVDDNTKDVAPRLTVNTKSVEVIQDGYTMAGTPASIVITSNKGYTITSDCDWLTVNKPEGHGQITVDIMAEPNETGAERIGNLSITSMNLSETVTVKQTLQKNLDDKLEIGHVYFFDDFSWSIDGSDAIAEQSAGTARNIYTWTGWSAENPLPVFQEKYEDLNAGAKTVYTQDKFLKFNKTNTLTGIAVKSNGIEKGKTSNVKVSFRAAFQDTSAKIVVAVIGKGQISGSEPIEGGCVSQQLIVPGDKWRWYDLSVDIAGLDADDKVIIGPVEFVRDNITNKGTFRWYIDDLKIVKIANK